MSLASNRLTTHIEHSMSLQNSNADLESIANDLRYRIVERSHLSGMPHLGSCLSCVDILTSLYFKWLNIDPNNPLQSNRDRLILSKGHAAPALFQALSLRGFYPEVQLETFGKNGSVFGEHPPTPKYLPGIEAATGSLGHGLPIGLGMAIASKINRCSYSVYVVVGDGECNEGSIWEAALMAAAQKINNLCVIVDYNKWQATGRSQEIMALSPMKEKWSAFGWNAVEVDGHDFSQINAAFDTFSANTQKPFAIIANTIKGKGISFMEDDNNWHYRTPNSDELLLAKKELKIIS